MISRNSDQIPQKSRRKITNLRRFQQHFAKISKNYRNFANFRKKSANFEFKAVQRYVYLVDLEKCWKNEYLVAKIGLDTAENEPSEKCAFGCCVPPPCRNIRALVVYCLNSLMESHSQKQTRDNEKHKMRTRKITRITQSHRILEKTSVISLKRIEQPYSQTVRLLNYMLGIRFQS